MKKVVPFMVGLLLLGCAVFPANAAFTALYVFGDGLSTSTDNPTIGSFYYGQRYSNGRVWVEVLAQRQALTYDFNKNWSYFGNTGTSLVTHVSSFSITPSDASNALFVVWVNCADLFYPAQSTFTNMSLWTNAINQSQTNHYKAITNLYAKGVRTLIMPNAVDISTIPYFDGSVNTNFYHLRCLDYNVAFSNTLNQIRTSCPDLTIYTPDFFTLLTNLLAYPANYGVTNALNSRGLSIDVIGSTLSNKTTNGPGTNFIFWDSKDPTAMVHAWMANLTQQLISPARIRQVTALNGSNGLVLVNVPIGQNGLVLGRTNVMSGTWATNTSFVSSNATQTVYVPASGTQRFYRLCFPYAWTWP